MEVKTKKPLRIFECELVASWKVAFFRNKCELIKVKTKKPLRFFSETSASWLPLMEVKSNQCCGKYCTTAHRNIVKTIGKTIEQKTTTKNFPTKLLKNNHKQTDLNWEIINCTNQ